MFRPALLLVSFFASFPAFAATLEVGPDREFKTLGAAVQASKASDTILVDSGTYTDDFIVISHPLTISAIGGRARLHASKLIPNGKGIIVANANLSIQNLIFSNAHVSDRNGAGIRHQKGTLVIQDSIFESNENGILGGSDPDASIIIQSSRFLGNGHGDGYSHGIYIGKIASLTVQNSRFTDTKTGHHIKSRARTTTIIDCLLDDGAASSSYAIDLPNGGTNIIRGNTLIQNAKSENDIFISVGTKSLHSSSSFTIEDNRFINFASRGTAVRNAMSEAVLIKGNTFFGPLTIVRGPAKQEANIVFTSRPEKSEMEIFP